MRKGKKWIALGLCAALLCSVLGCGRSADPAQTGQTVAEGQSEGNGQDAQLSDPAKESESASVTSMGRYMESAYALPEGAESYARTMAQLTDGRLAYYDTTVGLYTSEDEGQSWTKQKSKEELFAARKIGYTGHAAIAPDGSVAVVEHVYPEGEPDRTSVVYVDPAGTTGEVNGDISDTDFIHRVFFGLDNILYGVTLHGTVYTIDRTENTLKQLFVAAQMPEVLAFSGKLMLALEEGGVEIFNLETRAMQDKDAVLDDFCRENFAGKLGNMADCVGGYLLGAQEGIVYLAGAKGLFRHVLGGNAMEQIIEGSFSTFGDPSVGICNVLLLENEEFLLLSTGEELVRFTYDPNEPTMPEKLLRLYSLEENSRLRQAISAYQKAYPDVYVSYEAGIAQGSAVTKMDALKNLNLALMSGDGPDVILLDGIDAGIYADKGMLLDLDHILDEMVSDNSVYEKMVGAYRTEQGTFVLPAGFQLPLITGRPEDIDAVTDLKTLADVVERLSQEVERGTVTGAISPEREVSQLMTVCSAAWLKGRELDEAALTEFLTQAKRMYDAEKAGLTQELLSRLNTEYTDAVPIGHQTDWVGMDVAKLAFGAADLMLMDIGGIGKLVEDKGFTFKLWSGQSGAGFVPVCKLAISSRTERIEEAENFLRLMFSPEVQGVTMGDSFPVNRAAFEKECEWTEQSLGGSWNSPWGELEYGNGWPNSDVTDRLKELVEQADTPIEGNAVLEEAVKKYSGQILKGGMSIEQGVDFIKKEVAIYLSEQG